MSSKHEEYFPIKIVKKIRENLEKEDIIDSLVRNQWLNKRPSVDQYLDFLFGDKFLDPSYQGNFKMLNHTLLNNKKAKLAAFSGMDDAVSFDAKTEWKDMFGMEYTILQWAFHKQVYKFDKDFFYELINTEGIVIPQWFMEYIPFPDVFIDLSDIDDLSPIKGAFVHRIKKHDGNQLVVYMVTEDQTFFSFYSDFAYENGYYKLPEQMVPNTKFIARSYDENSSNMQLRYLENDCRTVVCKAIIQIMLYLSSEKKDVLESPITKRTYKKSNIISDKFSEVQMWDVGVRFGQAIRVEKSKHDAAVHEESEEVQSAKIRKQPRPHLRGAHWQRYHVGPGRKEVRVNWIPPTFVGGTKELPVTIREIMR